MRMRRLGQGQSVMFLAPLEVDRSIRKAANKSASANVQVSDVVLWAMLETCTDIQLYGPRWFQQGADFQSRKDAWEKFSSSKNASDCIETMHRAWR